MFAMNHRKTLIVITLLFLALVAAACTPSAIQPGASPVADTQGGITVIGRGEAFGEPDEARVQIGAETFAESVAEATSGNEENVQAIMAALQEIGIAAEDIQTSNYSLWAEQVYGDKGPEGIAGYRVSNQVNVRIRDIEKVGQVISAATEAGANNIHGVSFTVAEPGDLEIEARQAAISNARQKAQSLAEMSGVELGEIVSLSEVIGQPTPVLERLASGGAGAADAAVPSISPGEQSYTVQIQVTFAIQ